MCQSKYVGVNTQVRGGNSSRLKVDQQSLSICHWNIEGIQGKSGTKTIDPDFLREVAEFDIITLSETHVVKGHSFQIEGYCDPFEGIRCKHPKANKGSGGVAILVKRGIRSGVAFHQSNSPDLIWVQLKRHFFGCDDDIFIGVMYISPINSSYSLRQDISVWESLSADIAKYQLKGKVMLMGDLNTRTGSLPDFVQNDDGQYTPVPDSYLADDTTPLTARHNVDKVCHQTDYVDSLLDVCKSTGLRILNGRAFGDLSGKLTCHKWNGSSQVDYGIAQYSLLPLIRFFRVHDYFADLSDHCKISLCIRIPCPIPIDETEMYCLPPRFKWTEQAIGRFKTELERNSVSDLHRDLSDPAEDINVLVGRVTNVIVSAANLANDCPNLRKIIRAKSKPRKRPRQRKWFDDDCHSMRRLLKHLGSNMTKDPKNPHTRGLFFCKKKMYRALLRKKLVNTNPIS
jgi:exonuclease III